MMPYSALKDLQTKLDLYLRDIEELRGEIDDRCVDLARCEGRVEALEWARDAFRDHLQVNTPTAAEAAE